MEIVLPDGRKATVLGPVTSMSVKIRLEDGRETLWPSDKITEVKEGEDTLKMVVVPAHDRLKELNKDLEDMLSVGVAYTDADGKMRELCGQLKSEIYRNFIEKWGLI